MRSSIFLLLALGLSVPAQAEIFQWTDSKGTIHFTDDYDRVPPSVKGSDRLIIRSDLPSNANAQSVTEEESSLDAAKAQETPLEQESSPAPATVVSYDSRDIQVIVISAFGNRRGTKPCGVNGCRSRVRFNFNDRRYVHPSVFDRPRPYVRPRIFKDK
jgi:hypothetical protein